MLYIYMLKLVLVLSVFFSHLHVIPVGRDLDVIPIGSHFYVIPVGRECLLLLEESIECKLSLHWYCQAA